MKLLLHRGQMALGALLLLQIVALVTFVDGMKKTVVDAMIPGDDTTKDAKDDVEKTAHKVDAMELNDDKGGRKSQKLYASANPGGSGSSGAASASSKDSHVDINANDVVKFVECFAKYIYARENPKFDVKIRGEKAPTTDGKQLHYFINPNYAIKEYMDNCYKADQQDLINSTGFWGWIQTEKEKWVKEYSQIGTTGKVIDENTGKVTFEGVKQLRYWRRMPLASGLALRNAYYLVVKHLVDKLAAVVNNGHGHGGGAGAAVVKHDYAQSLASLKYLAHRMQSQVDSDSAIIHYTYLKAHLNFKDYTDHIEKLRARLEKDVSVQMSGNLDKFALTQKQKVKRVIWAVREIKYWKYASERKQPKKVDDQEKATKQELHMEDLLISVFKHIPIKRIMAGKTGKDFKGNPKEGSPSVKTALRIQQKLPHKVEIETYEGLNTDYYLGKTDIPADDDYYAILEPVLKDVFSGGNSEHHKTEEYEKHLLEEDKKDEGANDAKKAALKHEVPKVNIDDWIAPGEEKAEHILLVGDVGSIITMQSLVSGTYKYVIKGSISKFVQIESSSSPEETAHHQKKPAHSADAAGHGQPEEEKQPLHAIEDHLKNLHLVFGSEVEHLQPCLKALDNKDEEVFFTT